MRRVSGRFGDGGRVHHCLGPPHDGEGVARVGQVGLIVIRLALLGPLEDRRRQVRRPHVVTGLQ